jgi:hypothetical protein
MHNYYLLPVAMNSKLENTQRTSSENFKYVITKDESNVALEKIKLMFN